VLEQVEMVDTDQELGHFMVSHCGDSALEKAQLIAPDAMDIDRMAQELLRHIEVEEMNLERLMKERKMSVLSIFAVVVISWAKCGS
jgi:hypothetical protein